MTRPSSKRTGKEKEESQSHRSHSAIREYYGFVIYLSSFVALAFYLLWMFLPDVVLESIGITYYPSRHWGLFTPLWILLLIPFTILTFISVNLRNTPPLDSPSLLWDSRARVMKVTSTNLDRILRSDTIPELEDVPIVLANKCLVHDASILCSGGIVASPMSF